jgi:hypothetical protein
LGASVADPERSKEYYYYKGILSEDNKFMKAVQQIYEPYLIMASSSSFH